MIINNCVGYLN